MVLQEEPAFVIRAYCYQDPEETDMIIQFLIGMLEGGQYRDMTAWIVNHCKKNKLLNKIPEFKMFLRKQREEAEEDEKMKTLEENQSESDETPKPITSLMQGMVQNERINENNNMLHLL